MLELFTESFEPINLPFTILLIVVAGYWIIGLLGLVDLDALDGVGEGIDADGGVDLEGDAGDPGGFMTGVLRVVGASDAPLIFVISLFSIFLWALNLIGNHYFNPTDSGTVSTIIIAIVVVASFILTRLLVRPLRPLMGMLKNVEKPVEIIGSSGVVKSATIDQGFGTIEVVATQRTLVLNARLSEGNDPLTKGSRILVVSKNTDEETYIVRPLD